MGLGCRSGWEATTQATWGHGHPKLPHLHGVLGRLEGCWGLCPVLAPPGGCRAACVGCWGLHHELGSWDPPQATSPSPGGGVSAPGTKCHPMQMRLRERLIEGPCPASELQSNMQMASQGG